MTGYLHRIKQGIFQKLFIISIIVFAGSLSLFGQCPSSTTGGNKSMCSNNVSINIDATATNYKSLLWETTGIGSFNDKTTEDPIYTPISADINNGNGKFKARNIKQLTNR